MMTMDFAELSVLVIVCLCHTTGTAEAETVSLSVVGGSLSDLSELEEGDHITLRCEVTGLTMSSDSLVSWQHGSEVVSWNGTLREPYAGPRFTVEVQTMLDRGDIGLQVSTHELTISELKPADAGGYSCVVFTPDPVNNSTFTVVTNKTVALTVAYFPDESNPVCSPNGPVDVYYGDKLRFSCSTDKGSPMVKLTIVGITDSFPGPWSTIQGANTVSQEFLLNEVTPINNGLLFNCTISSLRFPMVSRSCRLGPLNVVKRPIMTSVPITNNTPRPGDPIGPQSSLDPPEAPEDPACRGWLIAFIVAAAVATLSIIFNVVFLTVREMRRDRKKTQKEQPKDINLEDVPTTHEREVSLEATNSSQDLSSD